MSFFVMTTEIHEKSVFETVKDDMVSAIEKGFSALESDQSKVNKAFFEALEKTKLGKDGELWLADAHAKVLKKRPYYACLVDGTYYDTGSKLGYLKANVDFALRDAQLSKDFRNYLKSVV